MGAGTLSALAVLAMFGMLPFTQFLAGLKKPDLQVREFNVTVPPPQFTPPEPPPPEPPPEQEPPPDMQPPPPQLSLSQLNMALNPGIGNALAGGFSLGEVGVSASETMEQISLFDISELDQTPRLKGRPMVPYSPRMKREKKKGMVKVAFTIGPDGSVSTVEVKQAIDDEYGRMFKKYFESVSYTAPTVAGKAVSCRMNLDIPVSWE
ncbi:hypothetical protein VDG1235_3811 [Verrucomicrobiia bacterium DG1235]|nr:hypothetical protein VDG1235_3811 [Verrucomicrobiae bacterium DG1235]